MRMHRDVDLGTYIPIHLYPLVKNRWNARDNEMIEIRRTLAVLYKKKKIQNLLNAFFSVLFNSKRGIHNFFKQLLISLNRNYFLAFQKYVSSRIFKVSRKIIC